MKLFSATVRPFGFLVALFAATALWSESAEATEQRVFGSVSQTENVRAELLTEVASVSPGASFWVALQLDVRDGWHTYWRNPGDSGEPTRIRWSLPAGVTASDIQWPFPHRIPYGPLVNYGYENRVLHLARMQVDEHWTPDQALEVVAEASWLVCEDICIPETASFRLSLPAVPGPPEIDRAAAAGIDLARARLPASPPVPARVEVSDGGLVLDVSIGVDGANIGSASFFPYEWGYVEPAGAQELEVRGDRLILKMVRGENVPETLDGVLVIEERHGDAMLERAVEISAAREVSKSAISGATSIASIDGAGAGEAAVAARAERLAKDEPFSAARLQALRAVGTPVFVNITAAWCITCKVNEQVALSSERVARVFSDRGIVYLEGDWTHRDAEISRYLRSHGRSGVPLYVVYDAAGNEPRVLPQLLTESLVLEAVENVADKSDSPIVEKRS